VLNQLLSALNIIEKIVGSEYITLEKEKVIDLSKDIIPKTQNACAFVYPSDIVQIQEILKVANAYKVPVWPVGQGKNWGYGGASPFQENSLVIVLNRLNKIIEVNSELAFALIEPGVTFRQLHQYLETHNIPLWVDCTDGPPDGSIVGNSLERGIGETDYGDHFGNICGLEVILPEGQLIRTGGGALENFRSWNTYKWGVGLYSEGLFSQSNLGIVTKMGVWLRPKPEYFVSCLFELKNKKNFPLLIDGLRKLQLEGALISKVHLINEVATMAVAIEDFSDPESTLSGYKFASWSFAAGVYGNKQQVKASVISIKKILGPLGKLEFINETKLNVIKKITHLLKKWKTSTSLRLLSDWICKSIIGKPITLLELLPHVHSIEQGFPSDFFVRHAYLKSKTPKPRLGANPVKDNCGLVWLGPMVPLIGKETELLLQAVEPLFKSHGFEMYVALMVGNPRTGIVLFSIFYDKTHPHEASQAEKLYHILGELTQKMGYQQYRTSTMYMDKIMAPAPEYKAFCEKIKKALDPNNIIAPGKYGIN
jgi:4-cresol dehydrogenase (hydroxylating)